MQIKREAILHRKPDKTSRVEMLVPVGDQWETMYDPETAHKAAGDAYYERAIPESCYQCRAKSIAEAEAEAAREAATR